MGQIFIANINSDMTKQQKNVNFVNDSSAKDSMIYSNFYGYIDNDNSNNEQVKNSIELKEEFKLKWNKERRSGKSMS